MKGEQDQIYYPISSVKTFPHHVTSITIGSSCSFFFEKVWGRVQKHRDGDMIQLFGTKVVSHLYLLRIMARGAAALGANCQSRYDMIYLFLYGSSDLIIDKVGFIIVQVKNQQTYMKPEPDLFRDIGPVLYELLKAADSRDFTVPIIRIVFALGLEEPSLEHKVYESPPASSDAAGHPSTRESARAYCVDEVDSKAQRKWKTLLGKIDRSHGLFSETKVPDVRKSEYPGGGDDRGHYDGRLGVSRNWRDSDLVQNRSHSVHLPTG